MMRLGRKAILTDCPWESLRISVMVTMLPPPLQAIRRRIRMRQNWNHKADQGHSSPALVAENPPEGISAETRGNRRVQVIPGHISTLDGLRAFAIMMVIFHHAGGYYLLPSHPTAWLLRNFVEYLGLGVDLFFVLSGFLITGILLDALDRPYFFKRFYWRRGLRIWPLYYVFLLTVFLVHRRTFSGIGIAPFALYFRNFLGPDRASDLYIGQFWSLCVEEQFYLIWPVVIYFLPKRWRLPLIGMLAAVAYGLRAYFFWRGTDPYVIARLPFCHMDVLFAGVALAVVIRTGIREATLRKVGWTALLAGMAGLMLVATCSASRWSGVLSPWLTTFSALFFGGIVGLCLRGSRGLPRAVLSSPFLASISQRSYAMYVFHLVPLYTSVLWLSRRDAMPMGIPSALLVILAIGLVTYGLAWLSWKYFEEPILRLKQWEWYAHASAVFLPMQTQSQNLLELP